MLTSLAYIFLAGLAAAAVCRFVKLPRIIGMLIVGVILGPHVLNVIDGSILGVSADLRQMALIIILIKAGLSLNLADLKKVGRPALLMSFLPAVFEIAAFVLFAPYVLGVTMLEAAIMGAVLGAVSPAVVVPKMVSLIEKGLGNDKKIPQLILAGASLDDVFVIVLFSSFVGMAKGKGASAGDFINIPVSVFTGVLLGAAVGFVLALFFEKAYSHGNYVRNSTKVLVILGIAFLLNGCEDMLKGRIALSGLLAVISMACVLKTKLESKVSKRISEKFGKLWIGTEVVLFVLVGAAVDIRYTLKAGPAAIGMIFLALVFRSIGVLLCLAATKLNAKERLFCVISYLPKATVQAAIGSVPLTLGLPCGSLVLSIAVLAILVTAPLGAIGMDLTCEKLLNKCN